MDDVIDNLIETLQTTTKTRNEGAEFMRLADNVSRVEMVQRLLNEFDSIPSTPIQTTKDNKKSYDFRQSGNKWMTPTINKSNKSGKIHHFDALENYNECICFAENDSEHLAVGYGKRSAVYFDLGLYEKCLENIQLAKNAGFPKNLLKDLQKRETDCKEQIKNRKTSDDQVFDMQLSFPAHKKIPFIGNNLDLRKNDKYGRHIITNEDIKSGQILAIEDSYLAILLPKLRYQRCANCLQENSLSLIPCKNCTGAMFCSMECYQTAQRTFHQFECPIIDYIHAHCNRIELCAIRLTISAFQSFESTKDLAAALAKADQTEMTAFNTSYPAKSKSEEYLKILTFPTRQHKRSTDDLLSTSAVTTIIYNQLIHKTKFNLMLQSAKEQNLLIELLFRHLQIARLYFHSLSLSDKQFRSAQGGLIGSGAYPFCSLINHSCSPNIIRIPFGTKMVVFALRNIKTGEQLFDNYGFHHYIDALAERQESMKRNYLFTCDCPACQKNYGKFSDLKQAEIEHIISPEDTEKLDSGDKNYAIENLQRFSEYLAEYDSFYPCTQLMLVQNHFRESLHIIAENVSIKLKTSPKV